MNDLGNKIFGKQAQVLGSVAFATDIGGAAATISSNLLMKLGVAGAALDSNLRFQTSSLSIDPTIDPTIEKIIVLPALSSRGGLPRRGQEE